MFKPGDIVERANGTLFTNGQRTATVESVKTDTVWLKETKSWLHISGLKPEDTKRKELREAIALIRSYDITIDNGTYPYVSRDYSYVDVDDLLNEIFPIETIEQKQLKKLEQQRRDIDVEISKLRKKIGT